MKLNDDIQFLKGVGPKKAQLLNKLSIYTIKDLIEYYPRNYEDRTHLSKIQSFVPSESYVFTGKIISRINARRIRKNLSIMYFYVDDGTGEVQITIFNQAYQKDKITEGSEYAFFGKIDFVNGHFESQNPVIVPIDKLSTIQGICAIYPLTQGITSNYLRMLLSSVLKEKLPLEETYTNEFMRSYDLQGINEAVKNIHCPFSYKSIDMARRRLIFDELFLLQLALLTIKNKNMVEQKAYVYDNLEYDEVTTKLPFTLTNAQKRTIDEIIADMSGTKPMNRLVQGDVGSGKTIVAIIAMYIAVKNGYQACLMAPTTILALQHYEEVKKYMQSLNMVVEVVTGNTTKKQKEQIKERLKSGEINILIGTHALLEDDVSFKNVSIIITDEQHRFGVNQRMKLANKGKNVDCMVMTATPIPRTLAIMLYSDMDMSIIDELPKGRKPIKTFVVDSSYENRMVGFMQKEIQAGRQIYVVCPLIEENEELDLTAAKELYERYTNELFLNYSVGFLNGKMKNKEKDEVMLKFKENKIQILVSTTVIEVGVNVPNATVMVIQNADRFGLAALHQLRGRVGRSDLESYCILVSDNKGANIKERLDIMTKTNDGYEIANKDLELRGPGDYFGIRQHGLPTFKLADLLKDMSVLKEATNVAKNLLKEDKYLEKDENKKIKEALYQKFNSQLVNIGT